MYNEIIIGLDENNKSSFYGSYIFSGFIINEQINNKLKNNHLIQDSKKSTILNMKKLYNYVNKNFKNYSFIYKMTPEFINNNVVKYKWNQNDLTMIGHLLLLKKIQENFSLNNCKIIIDDFMSNKKFKKEYLQEIIIKILKAKVIDKASCEKLLSIVKFIKFVTQAESKYRSVALSSQIGYINYLKHFESLSQKYSINYNFLIKNKNNYLNFFDYWSDKKNFSFLEKQVRWTYPKNSKEKMLICYEKIKKNIPENIRNKINLMLSSF